MITLRNGKRALRKVREVILVLDSVREPEHTDADGFGVLLQLLLMLDQVVRLVRRPRKGAKKRKMK